MIERMNRVGVQMRCPSYTAGVFNVERMPQIVDWAAAEIVRTPQRIGAIAGRGHSGVILAGAIAYKLRIPVIAVRKEEDTGTGHDSAELNAYLEGTETYAIIDDLVASGATVATIIDHMRETFPQTKPGMLLLYSDSTQTLANVIRYVNIWESHEGDEPRLSAETFELVVRPCF